MNKSTHFTDLTKKLDNKNALIGIVGLGYVGLPLLLSFANAGYRVLGFDIDGEKIAKLLRGETYIKHIPNDAVLEVLNRFDATSDFKRGQEPDALIICVPTPLDDHRVPDLSFVLDTVDSLLPYIRAGQIISLESTTYPGTTEEELLPRINSTGLVVGRDIALIYSPEREDPGNLSFSTRTIPKVVGGITAACLGAGIALYQQVIDKVVSVSSTQAAELTKLLENIHRAVNIGLVNEMKIVADSMNIDIHEVIRAAATKPFGFVPYYPGPGLGGHCIPIDPFYLTWKAREFGINTRFIELAGEVNSSMPEWVFGKVTDALNNNCKSVKGSRILVMGIAYKKNIDDVRESPAIKLMDMIRSKGAEVFYSDPFVPNFPKMREYDFKLSSISINPETISSFDCILLATNHDLFDYPLIQKYASLIVDTRGVYLENYSNVIKA